MAWDGDFEMLLGSAEALRTKATRVRRQLELQGHVAAVLREHTQLIEQLTQHYNNFIRRARQAVGKSCHSQPCVRGCVAERPASPACVGVWRNGVDSPCCPVPYQVALLHT